MGHARGQKREQPNLTDWINRGCVVPPPHQDRGCVSAHGWDETQRSLNAASVVIEVVQPFGAFHVPPRRRVELIRRGLSHGDLSDDSPQLSLLWA
jgi:hypothetical protein